MFFLSFVCGVMFVILVCIILNSGVLKVRELFWVLCCKLDFWVVNKLCWLMIFSNFLFVFIIGMWWIFSVFIRCFVLLSVWVCNKVCGWCVIMFLILIIVNFFLCRELLELGFLIFFFINVFLFNYSVIG